MSDLKSIDKNIKKVKKQKSKKNKDEIEKVIEINKFIIYLD
jgi:hypothetical protein